MAQSPSEFAFDAFLGFRGEDTRKNFTDHLHTALVHARINTFRDDRLEKGKVIKEELDKAIRQSRSSVIVLSKDYASSTWCLDELVLILELKRTSDHVVLPVFYDVDPSHVRKQTGTVEKAFTIHQETQSSSKLEKWRTALKEVADLAGMNLQDEADGHESKFIQKIVREIQDKLGRKPLSDVQEVLKKKLRFADQILNLAEGNQLHNSTVRESLLDLKEAIYDVEDLLHEIKTEVLRQEIEHVYECSTSKAQELVSTPSHAFDAALIYFKVDQVLKRLDDMTKHTKDVLDSAGSKVSQIIPSTSWVEEFGVSGRDDEKETLIRLLLSADENSNNIGVILIVGMGGIGKTTLAQLLYNDDRAERHFDKRAWACVSEKFDVLRISQEIYESLTSEGCNIVTLNLLQGKVMAALKGKRFFLVLDDMWYKSYNEWEVLKCLFQYGARGSRIIITTRNRDVASMVDTFEVYHLRPMPEEDGWSLFEKHAFKNAGVGPRASLEKIGRQIVKKCQGLPLAIKSLGGLLRSKSTVQEWKSILHSETWELPQEENNILSSLWLSYKDLTLELKRCFGYCSIFPKNCKFKRLNLILLWKAVGLLQPDKSKSAEEIGEDYFKDLVSRSFFQLSSTYYDPESYTMHGFHNDLASFVSEEFCVRLEGSDSPNSWSRTRHMNVISNMFEALDPPKYLRTLISEAIWDKAMGAPLYNLLPKLQCLMVLKLTGYGIEELPETVNNLKHLRQLDLSGTRIRRLPDSICTLYNLQALLLSDCKYLTELPSNLERLIKLNYLALNGSSKLGGSDKKFLNKLELDWGGSEACNHTVEEEREALEKLQPRLNLKSLTIKGFGGKMLGDWLGYYSSSALVSLELAYCRNCVSLPALGQLPSLIKLLIRGLRGVVSIGSELYYGEGSATTCVNKPFRSLRYLSFSDMSGWKEWSFVGGDDIATFPNLTELHMDTCPKLSLLPETMHSHLPSLVNLWLWSCPELECYPEGGFPSKLKSLEIEGCKKLNAEIVQKLNKGCLRRLTSLEQLRLSFESDEKVDWSAEMEDEGLFPSTLTDLQIYDLNCETIDGAKWFGHLNSLQTLRIESCRSLRCLPESGLPSSLSRLVIHDCPLLVKRCRRETGEDWPKIAHIDSIYINARKI